VKRGLRRLAAAAGTISLLLAVLTLSAASAAAPGHGATAGPLEISWASLSQNGQQLVWKVELVQPFSAAGLARDHRTLCLLIERVTSVCVIPPARGSKAIRLDYTKDKSGVARVISAAVTQTSPTSVVASFVPTAIGLPYRPVRWQVISTLGSGACSTEPHSDQNDCSSLYPARPAVLKLHTPVLVGCVASGPSLVYAGSTRQREIALTFDDGPWNDPPTSQFLGVLEREHVTATFFVIGDQISTYDPGGAAERRMLSDGDMIGDHTWSHPNMTTLRPSEQRAQLLDAARAINRATGGFTSCLWRPPYGATRPSLVALARSLGFLTIMWDIDPRDWALPGVGAISSNVVGNAHDGAIVIQHLGGGPRYQTLAALPQEIDTLRSRGYKFVTVDQLLGLRLVYR
jgi:peptidoglycan/xylan/chitin deacetylase (PgdA/CDA1 family)